MTRCQFCGAWNAEDEHHCGRCGRELSGQSPPRERRTSGNALPARAAEPPPPPTERRRQPRAARRTPPAGKVIPFESSAPGRRPAPEPPLPRRPRSAKPPARPGGRRPQVPTQQASLPLAPPGVLPVPAALREARVAPLAVRFSAAAVDALLVLLALGFFLAAFYLMGGRIQPTPRAALPWGGVVLVLSFFYRTLWCVLHSESAGMQFFHLRLLNFDGYEPEPAQRTVRLVAACLSVAAAGLGLLWALVDEEHLTWHDHISKTFPTLEPGPPSAGRRGR